MSEHDALLNDVIDKWARRRPQATAMLQHEDGRRVTYRQFASLIDYFALRLHDAGVRRGDRIATQLPTLPEHFCLMYACFELGALVAPLDLRLKEAEVVRDLAKIGPKAFFFLGKTPLRDFRDVGRAVRQALPGLELLVQFTPNPGPGELLPGACAITDFMAKPRLAWLKLRNVMTGVLTRAARGNHPDSPALIIYTTGTTGDPKPAVLTHRNILVQNEILRRGLGALGDAPSILVNLPPSHVAGTTEAPMTAFYLGGTAVLLRIFDAARSLEAIATRRIDVVGQIPTQYRMEWALPSYSSHDPGRLRFAIYAGSAVDAKFLEELSRMAGRFGTGIGMTETAGFVTFTPPGISVEEMAGQVGAAFDDLAQVSIRLPMRADGRAGETVPDGEVGEICYHPPIVFAGYYNLPEATAQVVSKEGILYSGDLGYFKATGTYRALYLAGRRKFVIKQMGYQVFPDEVQEHIARHAKVDVAEVVGVPHRLYDEGIFAFVKPRPGASLSSEEILRHCQEIAAYKRPQHVEVWPEGRELPLTRVAKVDKLALQKLALGIIERLRTDGRWDER